MRKIILTILALIMLTTPVVSSTSFASEPVPDEVIFAEAEEISQRIVNDLGPLAAEVVETLKKGKHMNPIEEMLMLTRSIKTFVAIAVIQMRSKVEELRMRGRGDSPLARKINCCCDTLIKNCILTGENFNEAQEILLSEYYASRPYRLNLEEYF